jgi:hypothetical protein
MDPQEYIAKFDPQIQEFCEKNGIHFYPWIGPDYCDSQLKVLLLGESYYLDEWNPEGRFDWDITKDASPLAIRKYLGEEPTNNYKVETKEFITHDKATRVLLGITGRRVSLVERRNLWHSVAYSVFIDDDKKPLIFKYDTDTQPPKFKVASYPPDKQYENEFGNTCKQLIFVHNGSYKPYSVNKDKKYVIPIFNLNYKIDYKGLWTNFKILKNPNGTLIIDNTSNGSSTIVNPDVAETQENYTSSNSNTISFSCYNVMSFDLFNMYSKIEYDVYDELGRKHTMSGIGTVNSCNYTITNNVVKADVTITELYNQNDGESTGSANSEAITMPVQQ